MSLHLIAVLVDTAKVDVGVRRSWRRVLEQARRDRELGRIQAGAVEQQRLFQRPA